jgi:hypothetical protein
MRQGGRPGADVTSALGQPDRQVTPPVKSHPRTYIEHDTTSVNGYFGQGGFVGARAFSSEPQLTTIFEFLTTSGLRRSGELTGHSLRAQKLVVRGRRSQRFNTGDSPESR